VEKAVQRGVELWHEGAEWIDLGGAPSHPGAPPVLEEEELLRVLPILIELKKQVEIPISIDTCRPRIAYETARSGADMINDITGFSHPEMREVAAEFATEVCVMHMQGTPETMQKNPFYPEGVVPHILRFFEERVGQLVRAGVKESRIVLDPGIGFGKTFEHNIEIYKAIPVFKRLGFRVMIGASRKKHLSNLLNKPAKELLSATLAIHTISLLLGADLIRVHDVAEHADALKVSQFFLSDEDRSIFSNCRESFSIIKD
jgi:dihydropteroate synthase